MSPQVGVLCCVCVHVQVCLKLVVVGMAEDRQSVTDLLACSGCLAAED